MIAYEALTVTYDIVDLGNCGGLCLGAQERIVIGGRSSMMLADASKTIIYTTHDIGLGIF